ncbi:hypothetical protein BJY04DRAFT_42660 [Aspergillus karnatakaensis]|uniref:uncharacterized protein n=1 Tax=Aspergillus karnatakaensis TaxID=1810916 RepID=UPI003CCD563F
MIADVLFVPLSAVKSSNPLSSYGLDSIIAVEFRAWFLRTATVDVSLFDILGAKSIEALVEKIVGMMPTRGLAAAEKVETSPKPSTREPVGQGCEIVSRDLGKTVDALKHIDQPSKIPLSPYQLRLWSAHKSTDDKSALNLAVLYSLRGKPAPKTLQQACQEVIQRNGSLRTRYFDGPDFPEQALSDTVALEFLYHDLSSETDPEDALQHHAQLRRHQPLNIQQGQNTALGLFKLSEDRHSLVFIYHHIAIDNSSTRSAIGQFLSIYDALSRETDLSCIPSPSLSYIDFSI